MNKHRRKRLEKIAQQLEPLHQLVEEARDEEQAYHDAMPVGIDESPRAETADEAITWQEQASSGLEEALEGLRAAAEI